MNLIKSFLLLVLCAMPYVAGAAPVATTAGSNLTAWNGNAGATNNNNWNTLMNVRSQVAGDAPTADFGNCNSLILRCAQPKCAGCTTAEIAKPIVLGCVNSTPACKQHADSGLVDFITAQLVSGATAKAQQQQNAVNQAAAAQSNAQIAQLQNQLTQMQSQMQQQSQNSNNAEIAALRAELEQQKLANEQAREDLRRAQEEQQSTESKSESETTTDVTPSETQVAASRAGVSEDLLARNQISGEILTAVENAKVEMKTLERVMREAFTYAGCDVRGNNCKGPKRVSVFKDKALDFMEPYDSVVDEMYDALMMAMAVGVDVSDIVMMLNNACQKYAKYLCSIDETDCYEVYTADSCPNGKSVKGMHFKARNPGSSEGEKKVGCSTSYDNSFVRGGHECQPGMVVPPEDDVRCNPTGFVTEDEEVENFWFEEKDEHSGRQRLGCATATLDGLSFFARRTGKKSNRDISLDVLERMLLQDASDYSGSANRYVRNSGGKDIAKIKYCALSGSGYDSLVAAINTKKLPKEICVTDKYLERQAEAAADFRVYGLVSNGGETDEEIFEDTCIRAGGYVKSETTGTKLVTYCVCGNAKEDDISGFEGKKCDKSKNKFEDKGG